jgi:hypothetical protein
MRKVVADQISALNALAEVVRKQSSTLDLSGPGLSVPQRETGGGKSEGAGSTAHIGTPDAPKKEIERIRNEAVATALRGSQTDGTPARRTENGGRATESKPQRSERDSEAHTRKLNAAARELAEAMNGDLPQDLERRYAAGETVVYVNRLYRDLSTRLERVMQQRYRDERLIRARSDAYMQLYERYLDIQAALPRGEKLVDASLATESGKLYLMLARISGRIGPH